MTEVAKPVDFLAHATAFLYDCSARARAAGVTTATPTERFVFHTAEGVQLQAYLRQGMMLPATKEAYETKYPRKDVETFLNELDKKFNLYQVSGPSRIAQSTLTDCLALYTEGCSRQCSQHLQAHNGFPQQHFQRNVYPKYAWTWSTTNTNLSAKY